MLTFSWARAAAERAAASARSAPVIASPSRLRLPRAARSAASDGSRALIYSRIRENQLDPGENDLSRAARQQQVIQAVSAKIAGFGPFPTCRSSAAT